MDFEKLSTSFVPNAKSKFITESKILSNLDNHNPFIKDSIMKLWLGFKDLVDKDAGILNLAYGTQEVTLKVNPLLPGRAGISLIRINFREGKIWLVKPGWDQLNCGNIHSLLKRIPQQPTYKNWSIDIIDLVNRGIIEIKKEISKQKV